MYTVYCYAYYFYHKGDQGRQQWTVCYYQGWNFKEHLNTLKASLLFFYVWHPSVLRRNAYSLYSEKLAKSSPLPQNDRHLVRKD